eukprot:5191773-Alexandrium_andersonii.AAC.1
MPHPGGQTKARFANIVFIVCVPRWCAMSRCCSAPFSCPVVSRSIVAQHVPMCLQIAPSHDVCPCVQARAHWHMHALMIA